MKNNNTKKVEYKIVNIISAKDKTELAEIINRKISKLIKKELENGVTLC